MAVRKVLVGTTLATSGVVTAYALSDSSFRAALPSSTDGAYRFSRTTLNVLITAFDYKFSLYSNNLNHFNLFDDNISQEEIKLYKKVTRECNIRAAKRLYKVCKSHGGIYNKFAQYVSTMNNVLPKEAIEIIAPLQDRAKDMSPEKSLKAVNEQLKKLPEFNTIDLQKSVETDVKVQENSGNPKENAEVQEPNLGLISEVFKEFDVKPVAAASLAQVHRAVLKKPFVRKDYNGKDRVIKEVAIKIQYPRLKRQTKGDVATIKFLTKVLGYFFPDFEYSWVVPEFENNLTLEMDFIQEGKNAMRMKGMFEGNGKTDVYVPEIISELSTKEMLVMEFVRGHKVTDVLKLAADGINPRNVARTVSTVFGDMIHVHGFVHCDPHAGNLMVRKKVKEAWTWTGLISSGLLLTCIPTFVTIGMYNLASAAVIAFSGSILVNAPKAFNENNNYELVVLDHGMYRRLEVDFRRNYCELWRALLMRDEKAGRQIVTKLGVKPADYDILSVTFTYRTPQSKFATGGRLSKDQIKQLRERFKDVTAGDLNEFLQKLPRDLLFVMRSTNIVRSLNFALGGTSRDRFKIMGESAVRGLTLHNSKKLTETISALENLEEFQGPYRINLPVASEVNREKKPISEWLEVMKLRSYVEFIDKIAAFWLYYSSFGRKKVVWSDVESTMEAVEKEVQLELGAQG